MHRRAGAAKDKDRASEWLRLSVGMGQRLPEETNFFHNHQPRPPNAFLFIPVKTWGWPCGGVCRHVTRRAVRKYCAAKEREKEREKFSSGHFPFLLEIALFLSLSFISFSPSVFQRQWRLPFSAASSTRATDSAPARYCLNEGAHLSFRPSFPALFDCVCVCSCVCVCVCVCVYVVCVCVCSCVEVCDFVMSAYCVCST